MSGVSPRTIKNDAHYENGNEAPLDPILREILTDHFTDSRRGGISARYLGEFLSKFKGRIENGARFDLVGVSHSAKLWRVAITNKTRFEAKKGELGELGESFSPQHAKNTIHPVAHPVAQSPVSQPAYSDIDLGQNDSPDSPDSPGAACGQKIDRLKMTPQDPAGPAGRPNPDSPLAPFLEKIARAYPPPVDQAAAQPAAARAAYPPPIPDPDPITPAATPMKIGWPISAAGSTGLKKKTQGAPVGNRNAEKQTDQVSGKPDHIVSTAARIALASGVKPITVRRDADFSAAVDVLVADSAPMATRSLILSGASLASRPGNKTLHQDAKNPPPDKPMMG